MPLVIPKSPLKGSSGDKLPTAVVDPAPRPANASPTQAAAPSNPHKRQTDRPAPAGPSWGLSDAGPQYGWMDHDGPASETLLQSGRLKATTEGFGYGLPLNPRRPGSVPAAEPGSSEISGCGVGDGAPHALRLGSHYRPDIGGEEDDNFSPGEVLLENDVLIASDERVETGLLRSIEQVAVGRGRPAHRGGRPHVMARQNAAHASRGVLVEQNPHPFEGEPILAKRRTAFTRSRGNSNISVAISSAEHPALALSTMA